MAGGRGFGHFSLVFGKKNALKKTENLMWFVWIYVFSMTVKFKICVLKLFFFSL